jgi:hypothetical protein
LTEAIKKEHALEGQVPDCIIMVSHADFLALLLAALNNMDTEGAQNNPDFDVSVHGVPDVSTHGLDGAEASIHGTTEQGILQAGFLEAGMLTPSRLSNRNSRNNVFSYYNVFSY